MIVYFKYKGNSLYRIAIYIKFVVTSLATLTLSFVWNKAAYIFGKKRSVGVIAITLILSAFGKPRLVTSSLFASATR